jgi:hypothetical protein
MEMRIFYLTIEFEWLLDNDFYQEFAGVLVRLFVV